jgi:hypothetical protein
MNRFVPGFFFVTPMHVEGQPTPDGQAHTVQSAAPALAISRPCGSRSAAAATSPTATA